MCEGLCQIFAQIVKPLQQMVKQSVQFKWIDVEKNAFSKIKTSIAHAPSLKSPNFEKYFILYTFTSDDSLVAMLTQKEDGGDEYPISFMSTGLQGVMLYYGQTRVLYLLSSAINLHSPCPLTMHVGLHLRSYSC